MAKITIETDVTLEGTKLMIDGKEITTDEKVVSISLWANAGFKSKYSGEDYPGSVSVSYETVDEQGMAKRYSYGKSDTNYSKGCGEMMEEDSVKRFIGSPVDADITNLVDKIIKHSEEQNIPVPTREVLIGRSLESLKDRATDIGLKLE